MANLTPDEQDNLLTQREDGMFVLNSCTVASLIGIFFFSLTTAFADTDVPTSYVATPGGRVSAEVNLQRKGTIRLRYKSGNPLAGKEKSQLCQGCHGESGESTDPLIPKLAGQRSNYISKQVRNYQDETRSHEIMEAVAETVNDEDLADIAAYFASQNQMKGSKTKENKRGKELFLRSDTSKRGIACVSCHGERGYGIKSPISAFPVIGGQHKDYIRQQLMDFRGNKRNNSPYKIMNRIAASLTDIEIESLAEYVSAQ